MHAEVVKFSVEGLEGIDRKKLENKDMQEFVAGGDKTSHVASLGKDEAELKKVSLVMEKPSALGALG